jgi:hypothetical protein
MSSRANTFRKRAGSRARADEICCVRRQRRSSVVGILAFTRNSEDKLVASGSANSDDNAAKLRVVVAQYKPAQDGDHAKALAETFRQAGYDVECCQPATTKSIFSSI